jgi:PEP-CTERM motif
MRYALLCAVASLSSFPAAAIPLAVFDDVNTPGSPNVVFNACDNEVGGPAALLYGCLNTDNAKRVAVTSSEIVEMQGGGQAEVFAPDAPDNNELFYDLTISFEDGTLFDAVGFNIDIARRTSGIAGFSAVLGSGAVVSSLSGIAGATGALGASGANQFSLTTTTTDYFRSVSFIVKDANGGIADIVTDVKQIRFGNLYKPGGSTSGGTPVPEPASLALLGAGLAGLGLARRRRITA